MSSDAARKITDPLLAIASEIMHVTGVQLGEKQRPMIESRIFRRMQQLNIARIEEYYDYFAAHRTTEMDEVVSLLTTHHTFFFREFLQFEYLEKQLPKLVEMARARADKTIQIWSAACSRGQEVYSLAMFFAHHLPAIAPDVKFKILGTDIDKQSVLISQNGVYARREIKEVPIIYLSTHWAKGTGEIAEFVKAKPSLRDHCKFEVGNLLELPAVDKSQKFDVIFCRNVFIYFTPQQIQASVNEMVKTLGPGGLFFVSVSESLKGLSNELHSVGPAIYSRKDATATTTATATARSGAASSTAATNGASASKPATNVVSFPTAATKPQPEAPLRVLCVDDSGSILALLSKILVPEEGFQIVGTASNGLEAAKKLKELKVDVMTLDIHMPEQTGVEYLQKNFNATHPAVVMVTAVSRDDSDLAVKAIQYGATDYVEKPALNNFIERSDEIRTKLRVAFRARNTKFKASTEVDKSFQKVQTITQPENKVRVIVCSLSDKDSLRRLMTELSGPQPATYFLVEGGESVLHGFAAQLSKESGKNVQYLETPTGVEQHGHFYLGDFKKTMSALSAKAKSKRCSICVYGEASKAAVKQIADWTGAQVLVEDLGNKKGAKSLQQLASDVVPATSFAYMTNEFLATPAGDKK